jgi:hypothetical protein
MEDFLYMIRIYNIAIPMENAITLEDVLTFFMLYMEKKSKFSEWYDNNFDKINNLDKINQNNIINSYFEITIKDIFIRIDKIVNEKIINKNENRILSEKISIKGGTRNNILTIDDITNFCTGIIFYLFSFNKIDFNYLSKPRKIKRGGGGGKVISVKKDLSGSKNQQRLILLTELKNGNKYVIKITPPIQKYDSERKIYQELTNLSINDEYIKDKIIKIHGFDNIDVYGLDKFINIKIDEEIYQSARILEKIKNIFLKNINYESWSIKMEIDEGTYKETFYYYVLDTNPNLKTYREQLIINDNKNKIISTSFLEEVIIILKYLYQKIGFSHMDFHGENLLVEEINGDLKFYLFDYDLSHTDNIKNDIIFDNIGNSLRDNKHSFLFYDISRFLIELSEKDIIFLENTKDIEWFNQLIVIFFNLKKLNFNKISFDIESDIEFDSESNYFAELQEVAIELSKKEYIYDNIPSLIQKNKIDGGSHHNKYIKYKNKYLNLKKYFNNF